MDGETRADWKSYAREVGHNLKRARSELGLGQARAAYAAGLSVDTLQTYEMGASAPGRALNPRLRSIAALWQVLSMPVSQLLPESAPELTAGR
jgi:DNA-binding XRE family transcriptional regulator